MEPANAGPWTGRFGIAAAGSPVVVVVDLGLGVAPGCIGLPRLGSNSCPPCSPCQVGAECTVPDVAAQRIVEGVAAFAGIECLWAAPGVILRSPSGETDQDCPRLVPLRGASVE